MNRWTGLMKFTVLTGLLTIIFLMSPLTGNGQAQTYGIPKTGQDNIYHAASGYDLGGDGVIQAGYPLGTRRSLSFQDPGNGTITDLASGLIWQRADSFSESFGGLSGKMTWNDAFNYVAALNSQEYGGYSDWRVPNIKELFSIINQGTWLPSIYYIFTSMQSANYWSSTSLRILKDQDQVQFSYYINFSEGFVEFAEPNSVNKMYVKAVRSYLPGSGVLGFPKSGQTEVFHPVGANDKGDDGVTRSGYPLTGNIYADNHNGTITQNATGMFWQQSDSATQSFGGYSGPLTWEEGFSYIAAMNSESFANYTDWRMPNYFELISLLDFGYFWPIIDPLFDPEKSLYWTSTNRFGVTPPTYAWTVSWASGWGNNYEKTDTYYIRAVRGGPVITPSPIPPRPSPTPYPRYGIPKTGQTEFIHNAGDHSWGDDGYTKVGYPITGDRFTDNGDGTITDNAAGLMWQKENNGSLMTWANAFNYIGSLNSSHLGNFSDWRMPNIKELNSLIDLGAHHPAISSVFSSVKSDGGYWGSTTYADMVNGQHCYQVDFNEGIMLWINMEESSEDSGYVKGVRSLLPESGNWGFPVSGQSNIIHYSSGYDPGDDGVIQAGYPANPGGRFQDNHDGTVTDRATGLLWQINDSAFLPVGSYRGYLSWENAFNYVREMNIRHVGGYSNWRLPNYLELHSLFDFSQFYPAVDPIFKNSVQSDLHWSSSSRNSSPYNSHWAIQFTNSHGTFFDGSTTTAYVIAVMGGPGQPFGPQVTTPTPGFGPTPEWGPTPIPGPTPPPVTHLYYGLPPTGQTAIYHHAGSNDPGDDGVTRIGYPDTGPSTRWEDTSYGTVIDWATGLMWQKSCSMQEVFGELSGVLSWTRGFDYIAWMNHDNYGGYSDWRMPNCLELLSTRNLAKGRDCYPDIFSDTTSDPFWSSTCPSRVDANQAFRMSYSYGELLPAGIGDTVLSGVRACRSFYNGISPIGFPRTGRTEVEHPTGWYDLGDDGATQAGFPTEGERYLDNTNGTITDNVTGLIWQQSCFFTPVTWENAFIYVKSLNQQDYKGYSNWRLPNQIELFSIIDFGTFYPTISSVFTNTMNENYWSSTSTAIEANTNAWAVNFGTAVGDTYPKTNVFYVRAVTGDPIIPGPRPTPSPDYDYMVFGSGDYNGDGDSDVAIFRSSSGLWAVKGITRTYFGSGSDIPAPGDYNGDGTSDIGIFRTRSGLWAIRGVTRIYFGSSSDTPIPGDYNGDGKCDPAVFRAGSGLWAIKGVTRVYFGGSTDQPVPGDYNGDGTRDCSIFRSGAGLWALRSISRIYFGGSQDIAIPGNYNTAPGWEVGVFRSSSGLWAIRNATRAYFGSGSDLPVPADYNGDTMDNIGIFRSSRGLWAIKGITRVYYGSGGDIPVTR